MLAKTRLDPYRSRREKLALKKFRELRLKEMKAWFILRELFFILLFLSVLYAITFANHDVSNSHQMVKYLRREFLEREPLQPLTYHVKMEETHGYMFEHIQTMDEYWSWLETIFVNRYIETIWHDKIVNTSRLQRTRIIGYPTLRQLRVKNGRMNPIVNFFISFV